MRWRISMLKFTINLSNLLITPNKLKSFFANCCLYFAREMCLCCRYVVFSGLWKTWRSCSIRVTVLYALWFPTPISSLLTDGPNKFMRWKPQHTHFNYGYEIMCGNKATKYIEMCGVNLVMCLNETNHFDTWKVNLTFSLITMINKILGVCVRKCVYSYDINKVYEFSVKRVL